jgi:hypothetical protein
MLLMLFFVKMLTWLSHLLRRTIYRDSTYMYGEASEVILIVRLTQIRFIYPSRDMTIVISDITCGSNTTVHVERLKVLTQRAPGCWLRDRVEPGPFELLHVCSASASPLFTGGAILPSLSRRLLPN